MVKIKHLNTVETSNSICEFFCLKKINCSNNHNKNDIMKL